MIRNLKALGLALVAVFALSAMAASAASAQTQGVLTSADGKGATLHITETGTPLTGLNALTAFGSSVQCPGTTYTGHEVNSTSKVVPQKATTATITPTYKQPCHVSGGRQATITTNGCDFVFHLGKTVSAGTWPVTADVVCPVAANGIHVTVFENTPPTAEGTNLCTLEVTGGALNQGLAGAHATNGAGDINVVGTFKNIHVERSGLCIFDGGGTTVTNGEFHIDATVKGTTALGAAVNVSISD